MKRLFRSSNLIFSKFSSKKIHRPFSFFSIHTTVNNNNVITTPITAYTAAVQNGEIKHDVNQLKVIDEIEELFSSLKQTDNDSNVKRSPNFLNNEQSFFNNTNGILHSLEKQIKKYF